MLYIFLNDYFCKYFFYLFFEGFYTLSILYFSNAFFSLVSRDYVKNIGDIKA